MSGRTEGGIRAATPEVAGSNLSFEVSVGHGSISLHVGEMSGRTEGGIQAATPEEAGSNPSFEASVGHGSISPLVGEMSGRTEGGIHAATPNDAGPNLSFKASVGHGSISPLEGEMSGRTEGGMHTETLDNFSRRQAVLQSAGVEVLKASSLGEFLEALASRDISTLMVEGGASVAKAFLAAGLVDRIILFTGPGEIGAQGIASPVTGTNIPAGFTHYRSETYGPDRCDYFERDL
ncbi:dihydrofolate reductase family protein [Rhizobium sp. RU36D]|uniref:RibD family protein n=1 Tax=Rhizobium sp. RU36D TaxID=1907415 RepID=UPI0032AED520